MAYARFARFSLAAPAALALLLVSTAADAQDALGSGDALDANLGGTSGGYNAPSGQSGLQYRARNLVTTGDVPGGRGFRASVGYTAPGDFRGRLGSDDQFDFLAGSAFSSTQFLTLPGAHQLRYGQQLGELSFRRSAGPTTEQDSFLQQSVGSSLSDRLRLDRITETRSSYQTIDTSMRGTVIGQTDAGALHASSLRGIRLIPGDEDPNRVGLSMYDRLRIRKERAEGLDVTTPGIPYQLRFDAMAAGSIVEPVGVVGRTEPLVQDKRLPSVQSPEYHRIIEQIAERYAGVQDTTWATDGDLIEQMARDYQQLQNQLSGTGSLYGEPGTGSKADADQRTKEALDSDNEDKEPRSLFGRIGSTSTSDAAKRQIESGLIEFGTVLRHGERIDRLGTNDVGRFNELLRSAEQRLREGEYFWAERRFLRALQFVPGHPTATAGLGHAQIGAGLYGSAALTLRSLFTHQPEMIDARYDERLLPSHVLLMRTVEELRRRGEHVSRPGHDGFLIAYVGHQLEDAGLVDEGLQIMTEDSPDDPMLVVLREVWTPKPVLRPAEPKPAEAPQK